MFPEVWGLWPHNAPALMGCGGVITTPQVGKLIRLWRHGHWHAPGICSAPCLLSVSWAFIGLFFNTGGFLVNKAHVLLQLGCITSLPLQGFEEQDGVNV